MSENDMPFDVVLLDLEMPDLDGFDTARNHKKHAVAFEHKDRIDAYIRSTRPFARRSKNGNCSLLDQTGQAGGAV